MENVKVFFKTHVKKFIGGAVLFVVTFGIYGICKLVKSKNEES